MLWPVGMNRWTSSTASWFRWAHRWSEGPSICSVPSVACMSCLCMYSYIVNYMCSHSWYRVFVLVVHCSSYDCFATACLDDSLLSIDSIELNTYRHQYVRLMSTLLELVLDHLDHLIGRIVPLELILMVWNCLGLMSSYKLICMVCQIAYIVAIAVWLFYIFVLGLSDPAFACLCAPVRRRTNTGEPITMLGQSFTLLMGFDCGLPRRGRRSTGEQSELWRCMQRLLSSTRTMLRVGGCHYMRATCWTAQTFSQASSTTTTRILSLRWEWSFFLGACSLIVLTLVAWLLGRQCNVNLLDTVTTTN